MVASDLAPAGRIRGAAVRAQHRGDHRARLRGRDRQRVLPPGRARGRPEPGRRRRAAGRERPAPVRRWATAVVGSLAGGAIVALSGTNVAFWVNAVTFAISARVRGADPGAPPAERAADRTRSLAGRPRGVRRRAAVARVDDRPRRLVDRADRDRRDQPGRDLPRTHRVPHRQLRFRTDGRRVRGGAGDRRPAGRAPPRSSSACARRTRAPCSCSPSARSGPRSRRTSGSVRSRCSSYGLGNGVAVVPEHHARPARRTRIASAAAR